MADPERERIAARLYDAAIVGAAPRWDMLSPALQAPWLRAADAVLAMLREERERCARECEGIATGYACARDQAQHRGRDGSGEVYEHCRETAAECALHLRALPDTTETTDAR